MGRPPGVGAHPSSRAGFVALLVLALLAGMLFFANLHRLWPLAHLDLVVAPKSLEESAQASLRERGFVMDGYRSVTRLTYDRGALDYAERNFGHERVQAWIVAGLPLFEHQVLFKKRGQTTTFVVVVHPGRGVLGYSVELPDDEPGPQLGPAAARDLAHAAVAAVVPDAAAFVERGASTLEQPQRRDHRFVYERELSATPELRERAVVVVAGDRVVSVRRRLVVPAAAEREARAAESPGIILETLGFAALGAAALAAFWIFLRRLQAGQVRLTRAAVLPAGVFVCLMLTFALESASLFRAWEPLWPRWVSDLRYLVLRAAELIWVVLVLLAVVAAGDAIDRESPWRRGEALWLFARGRWLHPAVARASSRGFLVGLICGGTLAATVLLLQRVTGSPVALQPRGFFYYTLNSAAPALTSVLFFFGVALAEELGYRFFGGSWLERLTGRRWLAIIVPALVYGLTHARLDFLPPAEPYWGRVLALTLVGCVWGWAFFRFGALTVVLSHYTADLFIFNWPLLASGRMSTVLPAAVALGVPLLPAALAPLRRGRGPDDAADQSAAGD